MKPSWFAASAVALSAILAAGPMTADEAVASPASDTFPDGTYYYYSLAYTPDIFACEVNVGECFTIDWNQWASVAFPNPVRYLTNYFKYSWSPSIYARSNFFIVNDVFTEPIDGTEWQRAGWPTPQVDVIGEDTEVYRWEGGSGEIFLAEAGGPAHKLSYPEWQAIGAHWPELQQDRGFFKLSWSPEIAYIWSFTHGEGSPISYEDWQYEGFPTPYVSGRIIGDRVYKYADGPELYYEGPTLSRAISWSEWQAMAFPSPEVVAR